MPLILSQPNKGRRDVVIILGSENIKRIKQKDPFELNIQKCHFNEPVGRILISYAHDAELTQIEQLARQGKLDKAIDLATSGWQYRPELGDHDLGPERLGST